MAISYEKQAEEALRETVNTGYSVRNKQDGEATLAVIIAATEEVKKIVDPTSAVGRVLLATMLDQVAWKLGTNHPAFQKLRDAAATLNPAVKK